LNKTLKSLAEEIEKAASIQGKIKGALIYPVVIIVLLIIVVFLMMIMVIPQMSQLFTQSGQALPLPTLILMNVSDFCVKYWPLVLVGTVGFVYLVGAWKKTISGRYIWDSMLLKLPILGPIFQKGALSKFARSFSNMMGSGVPIIKSIEIVAHAVGNEVYKRRLMLTAEDMRRGIPMAENMAESKLFPKILVNMIEVGEQTAQLETVVLKIAEFYDEEIEEVVKSLTKIMEPLILVVIGVSVGGLVAAIMLPIIQLTQVAGNI
jgi:type IV pilus assembly protein PilC